MELEDPTICYYCGLLACTEDHVIPLSILNTLDRIADPETYRKLIKNRTMLVPACRECNCLLGSTYQKTLEERKAFLKKRLKQRYKKLLNTPDWSQAELNEMGPNLKKHIISCLYERDLIRRRIRW